MEITTLEQLEKLLIDNRINTTLYGKPGTKSLDNLLNEIKNGETVMNIKDKKLTREVHVLQIYIIFNSKILTETNQLFHATPTREAWSRQRNCALAEKIYPGEDIKQSIHRSLKEELGIFYVSENDDIRPVEIETKHSASYPELESIYYMNKVYINSNALNVLIPDGYTFTEYFPDGKPRVTATWNWL